MYIRLSGSLKQLPPRGKDCPTLRIDSIGGLSYEVHIPDAHSSYFRLRLDALGDEKLPGKKALLLTSRGKSAERTGALERTMKALERAGAQYVYCPMVESNPVVDNVMKAALAAREAECDFVIALGGGSVMDCGKAVAMMATNPGDFWD